MSSETFRQVSTIVAAYLDIPVDNVQVDSKLEDLGLDSLGALEIIFEIEERFKIAIPNERAREFTTVQAVCDGVDSLLHAEAT